MNKLAISCPIEQMDAATPIMQAVTALTNPEAAPSVTSYMWFGIQMSNNPEATFEEPCTFRAADFSAATDEERDYITDHLLPGMVVIALGEELTFSQAMASINQYQIPSED